MKIYNKNIGCPKCGEKITRDLYNNGLPNQQTIDAIGYPPQNFTPEESIIRKCSNCGYSWKELPLNNN